MSGFTITPRAPFGSLLKGATKKEPRKSGGRLPIPDWRADKPKPAPVNKTATPVQKKPARVKKKRKVVKRRVRSKK